jgi:2-furoyl-CoA dehydrogenase large subunit
MLNPAMVDGQIYGGFAHGFGAAMMERVTYAADGTLLSGTFQDYLCPTAPELPPVEVGHLSTPTPHNVHGAKGLGDGCSMMAPVTMANAIADATGIDDLLPPFMPGRVWELLQGRDPDAVEEHKPAMGIDALPRIPGGFRGSGETVIDAPPMRVWQTLLDPDALRAIIPGCESVEMTGPETYRARVRISIAGIGGSYDVAMRLFDRREGERMRLSGRAESKLGFGEGEAIVTLAPVAEGRTRLGYRYVAAVGGRLAGFGQRMLDGIVRVLLATFFERLAAHLCGAPMRVGFIAWLKNAVSMLRLLVHRQ